LTKQIFVYPITKIFSIIKPLDYNGIVEEMLNKLNLSIKESLSDHLNLAISAKFFPVEINFKQNIMPHTSSKI
jgi:hypothetical protein